MSIARPALLSARWITLAILASSSTTSTRMRPVCPSADDTSMNARVIAGSCAPPTVAAMLTSFAVLAATIAASGPPPLPAPAQFVRVVDNAWFPLRPGTTYVYRGEKDGHSGRDVVHVTHRTR